MRQNELMKKEEKQSMIERSSFTPVDNRREGVEGEDRYHNLKISLQLRRSSNSKKSS